MKNILALSLLALLTASSCSPGNAETSDAPIASPSAATAVQAGSGTQVEDVLASMGLGTVSSAPEAPPLVLPSLEGTNVDLSSFRGRWVVVNFWATWCPPCRAEMPSIEALWKDMESRGLVWLAVSSGEEDATVRDFIGREGYSFPVLLDRNGNVSMEYQVQAIPTTYLIDPEGRVRGGIAGAHDWNSPAVRDGLARLGAIK